MKREVAGTSCWEEPEKAGSKAPLNKIRDENITECLDRRSTWGDDWGSLRGKWGLGRSKGKEGGREKEGWSGGEPSLLRGCRV